MSEKTMGRKTAVGQMLFAGGLLTCCLALASAQTPAPAQGGAAGDKSKSTQTQPVAGKTAAGKVAAGNAAEDVGERKFQQNCSRCHHAPQELSPRISGTVVMHMRVRASLSDADAQAILRYLAP
jgi:hypothetical protein